MKPPRVPDDLVELEASIELLGNFTHAGGKLKKKPAMLLAELLGALPSLGLALKWKMWLTQERRALLSRHP